MPRSPEQPTRQVLWQSVLPGLWVGGRVFRLRELVTDLQQFLQALGGRFRVPQFPSTKRVEDDLRDDQPRVFLVVSGHDVPGRGIGAGRA